MILGKVRGALEQAAEPVQSGGPDCQDRFARAALGSMFLGRSASSEALTVSRSGAIVECAVVASTPLGRRPDAPIRYFKRVYPVLRGVRGGLRVGRALTEPGRNERLAWVLASMAGLPPSTVLDAGCGAGDYAVALAKLGHRVVAVDVSRAMLVATRRAARAAGVAERIELIHHDLRTWQPARRFATVLSLGVAEYYPDAEELLERQYSWTRERLLVTWSAAGVGPRAAVRAAWLGLNGLRVHLLEAEAFSRMLARLPGSEVRPSCTRWTHCALVHRPRATRRVAAVAFRHRFATQASAAQVHQHQTTPAR